MWWKTLQGSYINGDRASIVFTAEIGPPYEGEFRVDATNEAGTFHLIAGPLSAGDAVDACRQLVQGVDPAEA
jgi:hypothetical protein